MSRLRVFWIAAFVFASACASPTSPGVESGVINVNGTILYFSLEGGFWAVRGDDGVTYNPMHGLGTAFRRENLRVAMVARIRNDLGGIHMVGPIVEVISIHSRGLSTGFPAFDSPR